MIHARRDTQVAELITLFALLFGITCQILVGYGSTVLLSRLVFRLIFGLPTEWSSAATGKLTARFVQWPDLGTVLALFIARTTFLIVGRLWFHPLAGFPGSKIAALKGLYEFYGDVVLGGQYTAFIKGMHEKYGPIVRISPDELHIDDPRFFDDLYSTASNPKDKWGWALGCFAMETSAQVTVGHDLHRKRRAPLNPFFSKRSVTDLFPTIVKNADKLCLRISEWKGKPEPVLATHAFGSFVFDTLSQYAFGHCYNYLEDPLFAGSRIDAHYKGAEALWIIEFFPFLATVLKSLPTSLVKRADPGMAALLEHQEDLANQASNVVEEVANPPSPEKDTGRTVFHSLLNNPELPEADRTAKHLQDEAQVIVGGGVGTTTTVLTAATFFILNDKNVLKKLKEELQAAIPDPDILPSLTELESLEYLNACICESHRASHNGCHRLARISPYNAIDFHGRKIPPGWPVSMTQMLMHQNEQVFPSPERFMPERFLGAEGKSRKKFLAPFSRGTRSCVGMNLADAMILCVLASVFRRLDLELYMTSSEDVLGDRDYFVPLKPKTSKGLQVMVK